MVDIINIIRKLGGPIIARSSRLKGLIGYSRYSIAYSQESMRAPLIEIFDALDSVDFNKIRELNLRWLSNAPRKIDSANILAPFFPKDASAGPRQVIALAKFLSSKSIEIHFTLFDNIKSEQVSIFTNALKFYDLGDSKVHVINRLNDVESLPHTTLGIATYWTTAYPLLFMNNVDAKMYFIQDEEGFFYPAGMDRYFAELTYSFGYIGLTNDPVIKDWYSKIMPCFQVPYTFLRVKARKDPSNLGEVRKVFTYYRYAPRNAPELVYGVVKELRRLYPSIITYFVGGYAPGNYGVSLGWVNTERLLRIYEESDLCLYFMFNLHSGIIPWECMDAGSVVITNRKLNKHPYLIHGYNSLIVNPTVNSVLRAIETVIRDRELRRSLVINGYKTVDNYLNETQIMWERFYKDLTTYTL
ncbi:glycosyltransferase [Vulcanisaeta sp. JCM 16159]|uniref:glycosyltransferase n=1 Tax=Vulcanisaeta sp. JCM 16159 TaxID=1295371 RepID=UPI0006CFC809|nr:glycosyltransferase [Vulcanisaeta sp. JCM 16159]